MAAEQQRLLRLALQRDPVVAGGVVVLLDRQPCELGGEPFARLQPRIGPGDALRAVFVAGECAEFFQFGDGSFRIETHVKYAVRV